MRLLPRLAEEDELDHPAVRVAAPPAEEAEARPVPWRWLGAVAGLSLAVRLLYLFFVADPENAGHGFTDAYHHWQIAYLTREIGLSHGPRLWDLRGWEYFWGLLHPALMNLAFLVTGSFDIVVARLLSMVFGVATVVLIFLLCDRHWGREVAVASAAFAALLPAAVFNDDAGMAEPIAVALILFGIWLQPARGFWAGVAWGLAAMARVEAWVFTAGLVFASLVRRSPGPSRFPLVAGWAIAMGLYMKFLSDQAGNAIYPLYWSYQFVFFGTFAAGPPPGGSPEHWLRLPLAFAVAVCAAGLGWSLWKRPRSYLLLVYGFGHAAYSFATFLSVDEWKERRFELPLDFAAILVFVFLFRFRPVLVPRVAAAVGIAALQLFWAPIQSAYAATEQGFQEQVRMGETVGAVYNRTEFSGRHLAIPGDQPTLTYTMVRYGGVRGDRIVSEFYDPFYYLPAGYHYADHPDVAGPLLQCWLAGQHVALMLIPPASQFDHSVPDYQAFMTDHPDWFTDTHASLPPGWQLVGVDVPAPAEGCPA